MIGLINVHIFRATSEYPAILFTYVGVLWRTRYIKIVQYLCTIWNFDIKCVVPEKWSIPHPQKGFGLHSPTPLEIPNLQYQPMTTYLI